MNERYIGLMSGTSMDAIDAVLVDLDPGVQLVATHSEPLPDDLRQRLLALCRSGPDEIERLGRMDVEMGRLFARAALAVLHRAGVPAASVRAIGSHGQTVRHRPQGEMPFTLQIGDPNTIAERTGIAVVADFRRRDMAAGGQGAPLVPAFHAGLFGHPSRHRIVLNLGGIANITLIPAGSADRARGHDTGPANTLLDAWSTLHRGRPYDEDGRWAASGAAHAGLLQRLLDHPFFRQTAPKSTGREDFHLEWLQQELAGLGGGAPAPADVQATLVELTAASVAAEIDASGMATGDLVLCGGGAYNTTLTGRLRALLPEWTVRSSADFGLAPTWVEATAFAWLARQTLHGRPGNLPAVTGAAGPRILGAIHPA